MSKYSSLFLIPNPVSCSLTTLLSFIRFQMQHRRKRSYPNMSSAGSWNLILSIAVHAYTYVKILSIFIRSDMIHWSVLRTSFDPPKKVLRSFLGMNRHNDPGLSSFDIINLASRASLAQYLKLKKRDMKEKPSVR